MIAIKCLKTHTHTNICANHLIVYMHTSLQELEYTPVFVHEENHDTIDSVSVLAYMYSKKECSSISASIVIFLSNLLLFC